MDLSRLVGLDFETYSAVNLPVHGLHRYVSDSTFTPLIASLTIPIRDSAVTRTLRFDFTENYDKAVYDLVEYLQGKLIAAHNAPFEQAVLAAIGIDIPSSQFVDSAVVARAMGAGSSLEAAAPQLLGIDKLEDGKRLILKFSIPGKYQEETDSLAFDRRIVTDNLEDWKIFAEYCDLDAELSRSIVCKFAHDIPLIEWVNQAITMDMNQTGWPVDVATVEEMQRRYIENVQAAEADFRAKHDADELNLNSLKQLKEWCAERGVKASSFDEAHVEKMIGKIQAKLNGGGPGLSMEKYHGYAAVLDLLLTKQHLGGSALKKLQVILDTTGKDCRLRDQYLHIGAGQTWRTTGRSVQMQNLKRLGAEVADMGELQDLSIEWDNDKLAQNMRQCFTSSHPQGAVIVGDFSSVESRGLAWQAGARDKLDAFYKGLDVYKVGAAKQYGVAYGAVTKDQRQFGKVGELSCGYQAGGDAVRSFAAGMGVELSEGEAAKLVQDWREANPEIVDYWARLDELLNQALDHGGVRTTAIGPQGTWTVQVSPTWTPASLSRQHPKAQSMQVTIMDQWGEVFLVRYFHGCYRRGRNICYYRPSARKTGDLWLDRFVDPKTKQIRFYSIYGGKLAGILTQSFCRELFFQSLRSVHAWVGGVDNLDLIGQFHDEIVLDWTPGQLSLDDAKMWLNRLMSDAKGVQGFPLEADIKHDYRYTK